MVLSQTLASIEKNLLLTAIFTINLDIVFYNLIAGGIIMEINVTLDFIIFKIYTMLS